MPWTGYLIMGVNNYNQQKEAVPELQANRAGAATQTCGRGVCELTQQYLSGLALRRKRRASSAAISNFLVQLMPANSRD